MEKNEPPSYTANPGGYPPNTGYPPSSGYPPNTGAPPQQGYPAQPGYQPQGYPQQAQPNPYGQPQYNTVAAPATVVTVHQPQPVMSFTGHIVFACVVFWCCGWLFGLIAFILAMVAQDKAQSGDPNSARSFGHASLGLSIAGLVVGIICIIVVIVIQVTYVSTTCYGYGCR